MNFPLPRLAALCAALLLPALPAQAQKLGEQWMTRTAKPQFENLSVVIPAGPNFLAGGDHGALFLLSPDNRWTQLPSATLHHIKGLLWTGSLYIATGERGLIMTSPDAKNWTVQKTQESNHVIESVAYTGSFYVAAGYDTIYTSPDSVTWSKQPSSLLPYVKGVASSGLQTVVCGNNGVITSQDGQNWSTTLSVPGAVFRSVIWSGSLFITSTESQVWTSPDGITWTKRYQAPGNGGLLRPAWTGSRYIVLTSLGFILSSQNGTDWQELPFDPVDYAHAFAGTPTKSVVVGNSGMALVSTDMLAWSTISHPETGRAWNKLIHTNSGYWGLEYSNVLHSTDGVSWTQMFLGPSSIQLLDLAYNGSLFVAVGSSGAVFTSNDGANWQQRNSGTTKSLQSVIWAGTMFWAVGEGGVIIKSSNGVSWQLGTTDTATLFMGIAWSGNTYVEVGGNGRIMYSTNGTTWNYGSASTTKHFFGVTWTGSQFIAVGQGIIATSSNGISWTKRLNDPFSNYYLRAATIGNSSMVAVGDYGRIYQSSDGITWTAIGSGTTHSLRNVFWNGSQFVATEYLGSLIYSNDGKYWPPPARGTATTPTVLHWDGTRFLAFEASRVLSSLDGARWDSNDSKNASFPVDACTKGTRTVAVGSNNSIIYTANGTEWNKASTPDAISLTGVAASDSLFVVVGYDGVIMTSPDGATWTPRTSGSTDYLYDVAWTGNQFIAVGTRTILSSASGINWLPSNSGAEGKSTTHIYAKGPALIAFDGSTLLCSTTGQSWLSRNADPQIGFTAVCWSGNRYVLVGPAGAVWTSDNGLDWTSRSAGLSSAESLRKIIWSGSEFLAVGTGVAIRSPDGISWTRTTPPPYDQTQFIYANGEVVSVGYYETDYFISTSESGTSVWAENFGLTPPNTLWNLDPDQDGLPNALERFLGRNPNSPLQASSLLELDVDQNRLTGLFLRPSNAPDDTILQIQESFSLEAGSWEVIAEKAGDGDWTGPASIVESLDPSGLIQVRVQQTKTLDQASKGFLRLSVKPRP